MMDIFAGGTILIVLAVLIGLWAGRNKGSDDKS